MSEELAVPGTGEIVNLDDESQCVAALAGLRDFESMIKEAKSALTNAIIERSRVLGSKTLHLDSGLKAEIRGGEETVYDAEEIEEGLRALGMPEDRIREIVIETVSYKVAAIEAKRAASANEEYGKVIDSAKMTIEKPQYVSISKLRR